MTATPDVQGGPAARTGVARRAAMPLTVSAAVAAPWVLDAYTVSLGSYAIVLGLVAVSTRLLTAVAGMPTLGQGAYLIIGGYTAAALGADVTSNGPLQLLAAAAAAAAVAAIVGALATRTRGTTFLITTVAVGVLTQAIAGRVTVVTGGDGGRSVAPITVWPGTAPLTRDGYLYLYALVCALAVGGALALLLRSRFGLTLRGVAGDEARVRATGVATGRVLWVAYVIAAATAGTAGAVLVAVRHTIAPSDGGFTVSALAFLAALLAGRTQIGVMLGAAVIIATRDMLAPAALPDHANILLGCLFLAVATARVVARRARTGAASPSGGSQ